MYEERFTTITEDELNAIINNPEKVPADKLTPHERLAVIAFDDLKDKMPANTTLYLDCNYHGSLNHKHPDPADDKFLVDYYRLNTTNSKSDKSLIQFYAKTVLPTKNNDREPYIDYEVVTSCAELNREQLTTLSDDLKFTLKLTKQGKPRYTIRRHVTPEELPNLVAAVLLVLQNTAAVKEKLAAERSAKNKAEADKKKADTKSPDTKDKSPDTKPAKKGGKKSGAKKDPEPEEGEE